MSVAKYFNPTLRPTLLRGVEPDWLRRHKRRAYIRQAIIATPTWVNREHLKRLHAYARFLTITTGVEHVLDHIIPLNHPAVCGLTVPSNLRIITRAQNASKSGKWNPDQLELFCDEGLGNARRVSAYCDPWKHKPSSSNAAAASTNAPPLTPVTIRS
jgi:hypothetical protein